MGVGRILWLGISYDGLFVSPSECSGYSSHAMTRMAIEQYLITGRLGSNGDGHRRAVSGIVKRRRAEAIVTGAAIFDPPPRIDSAPQFRFVRDGGIIPRESPRHVSDLRSRPECRYGLTDTVKIRSAHRLDVDPFLCAGIPQEDGVFP